jgi:hypothetical protein
MNVPVPIVTRSLVAFEAAAAVAGFAAQADAFPEARQPVTAGIAAPLSLNGFAHGDRGPLLVANGEPVAWIHRPEATPEEAATNECAVRALYNFRIKVGSSSGDDGMRTEITTEDTSAPTSEIGQPEQTCGDLVRTGESFALTIQRGGRMVINSRIIQRNDLAPGTEIIDDIKTKDEYTPLGTKDDDRVRRIGYISYIVITRRSDNRILQTATQEFKSSKYLVGDDGRYVLDANGDRILNGR